MCGIVGIASKYQEVGEKLINSLKRLEYRGYDSAGIAVYKDESFSFLKTPGKVKELEKLFQKQPLHGVCGIGHTRWATHGVPSYENSHPMVAERVTIVHNGIIENHQKIKQDLEEKGYSFKGETDTEVLCYLLDDILKGHEPLEAIKLLVKKVKGLYSFVFMVKSAPGKIFAVKMGLPLAIGIGDDEMYFGSDAYALFPFTNKLIYLEDGEFSTISPGEFRIFNAKGEPIVKEVKLVSIQDAEGKTDFDHYMLKEIYEQPRVLSQCFNHYYDVLTKSLNFPEIDFSSFKRINIVACGTSFYAAMVAKYWFERDARISTNIDIASEFRYKDPIIEEDTLFIFISQSGETADTLAALKYVKEKGVKALALVNNVESSIGNLADYTIPVLAGIEVGVASTKAFTNQLMILALLNLRMQLERDSSVELDVPLISLHELPNKVTSVLSLAPEIDRIAKTVIHAPMMLYTGRGTSYPIALEGALKIKEVAYIPVEGIAAGELKHGPIALIDASTPVVVIAPDDELFEKTASNLQEIQARGGRIILFSTEERCKELAHLCQHCIEIPSCCQLTSPFLYAVALQLFAYHFGVAKGLDVDKPRNLAKSVTVE
jgi:glucosamine--fructose-6-phosphate aminotransferase (isomerizing)